jgi:putative DNA primase/helicase
MSDPDAWSYPPGIADAKTRLDCALAYADAGFRVFPYNVTTADKRPHIKGWPDRATTDETILTEWWPRWPQADVGWPVPNGTVAIDLDVKNGNDGIKDFIELDGRCPFDIETPIARTRSGGLHLFFAVERNVVGNSAQRHGRAIDIRTTHIDAHGNKTCGPVVLPTPLNGRVWLKPPLSVAKAQAPGWLIEQYYKVEPLSVSPMRIAARHTAYGRRELERLCWRIKNAPHGRRDVTRNGAIFSIAQYVAGGEMEESDAWAAALEAAHAQPSYGDPVDPRQIDYQARRSFAQGLRRPLSFEIEHGLVDIGNLDAYEKWARAEGLM